MLDMLSQIIQNPDDDEEDDIEDALGDDGKYTRIIKNACLIIS